MNERKEVRGVSFSCGTALLRWRLAIIVSLACMVCAEGAVVSAQWIENPANGHWYRLTSGPLDIGQARIVLVAYGGYLVAINTSAENEFIVEYFMFPGTADINLWIDRWNDTDGYINQKYGLIERDSGSFIRPDCNADGAFNIADAIKILSVLFSGGLSPDCLDACDANDDGSLNLSDAVMMLNALYVPGSAPIPLPNPGCSIDPTDDTLDCNGYTCP